MSEDELEEIRAVAERHRTTVSEWVRGVLREERARERPKGVRRVTESRVRYGGSPETLPGRIRIELEVKQELLDAVQARFHLPSRRAAVEFALRRMAVTPMSKDEALGMQGVGWEGDLEELRSGDPGADW